MLVIRRSFNEKLYLRYINLVTVIVKINKKKDIQLKSSKKKLEELE